jgi:hypothetical protein
MIFYDGTALETACRYTHGGTEHRTAAPQPGESNECHGHRWRALRYGLYQCQPVDAMEVCLNCGAMRTVQMIWESGPIRE